MKTSKNKTFIIILGLLISGLLNFIPTDSFAATGPVTVSLTANPQNVNKGEKTSLSWNSTNADFCVAYSGSRDWHGIRALSGNETIVPQDTTTYRIICSNNSGFSGTSQVTVRVSETAAGSSVSVNITANPESIFRGEFTTLIWSSTNAVSCEATGGPWAGVKQIFGSELVSPSVTTYYTLRCNNSVGEYTSDTQVIFVNPSGSTPIIQPVGQFNTSCVVDPARVSVGQTVTFAGAQSRGMEPVNYRWSGDISGNTQTVKTSFSTPGTKTATLTVTDSTGKTASATCSAEIIQSTGVIRTTPRKLSPPTNLKPNGDEFPADTKEVTLSWDKVTGAKFYAVRMDPENKTDERDSRNNCPNNPHYLCVNELDSTSIKLEIKPGTDYNWWVHSVDANGVFSDSAFAKFSVQGEETSIRDNLLANIFGGISRISILYLILLILAFILGYVIGKGRKTSLTI